MTHIPDEAVQAANDAYRLNYAYGKYGVAMKSALTAALPHLSVPCAVGVQQLDWTAAPNHVGAEGLWFVAVDQLGRKYEVIKTFNGQLGEGWAYRSAWFQAMDQAKSAAQADFERRILSCVVTKTVDVSAGLEQAAIFIDQRIADYVREHGMTDPETGTVEFPGWGDEYVSELEELAEGIRALSPNEPAGRATLAQGGGSK